MGEPRAARAAIMRETGAPLSIEAIEVDEPGPGEVLLRLAASGVCHSDLHSLTGTFPWVTPSILGHEGAGVVEAVGAGVAGVAVGDHAILTWLPYCGSCRFCTSGRKNVCERQAWVESGLMQDGSTRLRRGSETIFHALPATFAERTVVPAQMVIPVERDLDLVELSLFGCAIPTGVGAVFNTAAVQPGDSVAVVGCGGVGLSVVQGARLAGAGAIVAIDPVEAKRELALTLGATAACDPDTARAEVRAEHVFEAVGAQATIDLALALVDTAGQAILIGMAPVGATAAFEPLPLTMAERGIRGSWYGGLEPARDYPRLLDWYRAGELQLGQVVERIALDDINEAFDRIRRGEAVRSVIVY